MKMLFSPKLLPFCLALPEQAAAFPWAPLHVCAVSHVPAAAAAQPAEGGRCSGGRAGGVPGFSLCFCWGSSDPPSCSRHNKVKPSREVVR